MRATYALHKAQCDWVLLLDADMSLDRTDFIEVYAGRATLRRHPCCIVGGFRVDMSRCHPQTLLHAAQSLKSECKPAAERARDPGGMSTVRLSSCIAPSWRGTCSTRNFRPGAGKMSNGDGALSKDYPIYHIDNPARHRGLDEDRVSDHEICRIGRRIFRRISNYTRKVWRKCRSRGCRMRCRGCRFNTIWARFFKTYRHVRAIAGHAASLRVETVSGIALCLGLP